MRKFLGVSIPVVLFILSACNSTPSGKDKIISDSDSLPSFTDSVALAEADTLSADTVSQEIIPYVVIDKPKLKLYVVEGEDTVFKVPICAGRVKGDKQKKNDRRTPEGDFKIINIHDASGWLYHTDDGRWVPHVYGPWFIRLDANGWEGIGIHGTNAPWQIGQRRSKGCIRLKNEDISTLHDLVYVGMSVKIVADDVKPEEIKEPEKKIIIKQDTILNKPPDPELEIKEGIAVEPIEIEENEREELPVEDVSNQVEIPKIIMNEPTTSDPD